MLAPDFTGILASIEYNVHLRRTSKTMQGQLVASRYRILRELGRGGMGVVYVVEHVHMGEQLALKVLHGAAAADPGAIARFQREARVGSQIKSEHVVRVIDAD